MKHTGCTSRNMTGTVVQVYNNPLDISVLTPADSTSVHFHDVELGSIQHRQGMQNLPLELQTQINRVGSGLQ